MHAFWRQNAAAAHLELSIPLIVLWELPHICNSGYSEEE